MLGGEGATKTIDTEEFEGEEGNLAVGISMEIEEALGLVLAQVGNCGGQHKREG